ncbi:MAG: outer membrane beta-barrel protein [Sphingomicrobium sp.]
MRKIIIAALASTLIAAPAMARDGSPYLGIEGGLLFPHDMNIDTVRTSDGAPTNNAFQINYNKGYDLDLIGGYDFGMVRAEAELGYKHAAVNDLDGAFFTEVSGGPFKSDGKASVTSIMGNLLLDFGNQDGLSFYAGPGVGWAKVKLSDIGGNLSSNIPNGSDSGLAWQLIAGLRYAVSPNVDIGLKYRYFHSGSVKFTNTWGSGTYALDAGHFRSHSLLASLIFNFGAPAPAPVVMAPPPPPPAPMPVQTQTCYDGSVIEATAVCPSPPPPPAPAPAPQPGERG